MTDSAEPSSKALQPDPESFGRAFFERALEHAQTIKAGAQEQKGGADQPVEFYMKVVVHTPGDQSIVTRGRQCVCTYYGDGDLWFFVGDACIDVC